MYSNDYQERKGAMKKVLYRVSLLVFGVVVAFIAYNYLNRGVLSVSTTSKDGELTVRLLEKHKDPNYFDFDAYGKGVLRARLKTGEYVVSLSVNKKVVSEKTVLVERFKTTNLVIDEGLVKEPLPALSVNASSFVAGDGFYKYLDADTGFLSLVKSDGSITRVYVPQFFQKFYWINSEVGYGQDEEGRLYRVFGQDVKKVNAPTSIDSSFSVDRMGNLYIVSGSVVYFGSESSGFKKIYESVFESPQIFAGDTSFVLTSIAEEDGHAEEASTEETGIELVSSKGALEVRKDLLASDVMWSPNYEHLLVTDVNGLVGVFTKDLRDKASLSASAVYVSTWLDNNYFLYAKDGNLWSHNFSSNTGVIYSRLVGGDATDIIVGNDFIYTNMIDTEVSTILKIPLGDQPPSGSEGLLGVLPLISKSGCYGGYVNINKPLITVQLLANTSFKVCSSEIKEVLKTYNTNVHTTPMVPWNRTSD